MSLTRILRKHMNKLLWVLVIFIAVAFGVTATMTDVFRMLLSEPWAKMFGREVSHGEFMSAKRKLTIFQGRRQDVSDDQVWEYLVLLEEAQRTGIVVTARELRDTLLK
jgi:hypothetical protein